MRTKKSIINMVVTVIVQCELILLGILTRRIFIQNLSVEYLGCNSIFSNILEILSLVGCGASAVSYLTIKALASDDQNQIRSIFKIVHLYQWVTCSLILGIGIIVSFFLSSFLANSTSFSWRYLQVIYLLFLLDLCVSMWGGMGGTPGYYDCVIKSSQNLAICSLIECIVKNFCLILQIIFLYMTKSYILYLTAGITTKFAYIILTRAYCYNKFPFLREKVIVTKKEINEIHLFAEIRNNLAITIAVVVFNGTDNLVLASGMGITITALYSNYILFYNHLRTLISKFIDGMSASVGNYLYAINDESEKKLLFDRVQCLCGIVGLVCSTCFYNLVQPFIELFFDRQLLLGFEVAWTLSFLLFTVTFSTACSMFRHPIGQYWLDRNYQFLAAAVNLVLSLLLVRQIGIVGVLIGTIMGCFVSTEGYLKVVCNFSVPGMKKSDWWQQAVIWHLLTAGCLFLSSEIVKKSSLTIGGLIFRGITSVGISFGFIVLIGLVSPRNRNSICFLVSKIKSVFLNFNTKTR